MSSSKVFKMDPQFTPRSLVRRNLPAPRKEGAPGTLPETPFAPELTSELVDFVDESGELAVPAFDPEPDTALPDIESLRQESYNQGRADLAAEYHHEFQLTAEALLQACQKIDQQRQLLFRQSRSELINLIVVLSGKILGQELNTPRHAIATTLASAMEQAIECEEYYVTLHPDDLAFAEAKAPELIAAIRGLERLVFKTDPSLTRGGCLLESAACSIDATIEGQLETMREFLDENKALIPVAPPEETPPEETPPVVPSLDLNDL